MGHPMRSTSCPEGIFQERENFLHAMAQLEIRQLKLTGHVPHSLAGGGQQIDAALAFMKWGFATTHESRAI
jgi:hypothetical protein